MESCAIVPLPQTVEPATVFPPVGGQSPLARVVRALHGTVADARIVVATVPALAAGARDCLRSAGLHTVSVIVSREPGSRRHVLTAGLDHLAIEQSSSTTVLVCDHRHPLSTAVVAARVVAALRGGHDVVVPTLPVTDTVKTVDESGTVLSTLDRSTLRTVQYPRGFAASALWDLISDLALPEADDVDEFTAALRAGLDIGTVDGDANAFRVELPRDAHLLDAIIACRPD
jgi:2-C-methyl-D-erythritol 4-phosphate cytidylyltransferase